MVRMDPWLSAQVSNKIVKLVVNVDKVNRNSHGVAMRLVLQQSHFKTLLLFGYSDSTTCHWKFVEGLYWKQKTKNAKDIKC